MDLKSFEAYHNRNVSFNWKYFHGYYMNNMLCILWNLKNQLWNEGNGIFKRISRWNLIDFESIKLYRIKASLKSKFVEIGN